jgi:hypothetical protein
MQKIPSEHKRLAALPEMIRFFSGSHDVTDDACLLDMRSTRMARLIKSRREVGNGLIPLDSDIGLGLDELLSRNGQARYGT